TLVRLWLDGVDRTVRLTPYSMRSEDARLVVDVGAGVLVDHAWPAPATYRGVIDGVPDIEVAASILDGQVSMMLLPRDHHQPTWFVQPLSDAVPGVPVGLHVIYRGSDVRGRSGMCGTGMVIGEGPAIEMRGQPQAPA